MRHALVASAMVVVVVVAQQPDPLLWGGLHPGPHGIGYRSYFALDSQRHYGPQRGPRPVLVNLWYPAIATNGAPLLYGDYLTVPQLARYPRLGPELEVFLLDTLANDLFQKKRPDLNQDERTFLNTLLSKSTLARRDAPPAGGSFPVLVYHPGAAGSYEENSVLCEYLASHGYVVMTTAFPSPDGKHVSNNFGGSETSWGDLVFLLAQARTLGVGNPLNVGAFGHSMGAQYLLAWLGRRDTPVRAMVSLDNTLEYTPDDFDGHRWLRKQTAHPLRPSVPVLIAASADRNPRFSTWDRYLPVRAEAAIRYFGHGDFLLHGSLARAFSQEQVIEVRSNYDLLGQTVRAFFDLHLRGATTGWQHLLAGNSAEFRLTERSFHHSEPISPLAPTTRDNVR